MALVSVHSSSTFRLDFVVISSAYILLMDKGKGPHEKKIIQYLTQGILTETPSFLRTFRVFRALKTISLVSKHTPTCAHARTHAVYAVRTHSILTLRHGVFPMVTNPEWIPEWIPTRSTVYFVKTKQKRTINSTRLTIVWHVCQYKFGELSSRTICRISGIRRVLFSLLLSKF